MKQPLPESQIISRRESGLAPPRQPRTKINPKNLTGVVVHWFGIPAGTRDHSKCDDIWRGVQRAHMGTNARPGEFIDIAYNMGVCPHGKIYRGRGTHYMTGANGNGTVNRQYGAVVYMAGKGGPTPPPVAVDSIHRVIQQYRHLGAGRSVRTHGSITGSECPGPVLTKLVKNGRFRPDWKPL